MNSIITRFAPSPTGNLHIGSVRTALINYIVVMQSRKKNVDSKFLLRIEDTDFKRSNDKFKNNILNGLKWMNIKYDEEPYIQSEKIKRHQEVAKKLIDKKKAFKCICTPETLNIIREENRKNKINTKRLCKNCEDNQEIQSLASNFVVRIKIPKNDEVTITDMIQGNVTVKNIEVDDFVLLRKNGSPTYMLSVVVDDHDMGVNLIIRGDDHLNNVFRQNFIYTNMNWEIPSYAHLPLIHGDDGKKLSKRHGAVDINQFKENGYLEESIINNLILLGWSSGNNNEIINLKEIIELFDIKKLSKSSSIFSYEKLNFFNNHYIKNIENSNKLIEYCNSNLNINKYKNEDEKKFDRIISVYKKNIKFYKELEDIVPKYYNNNLDKIDNKLLNNEFKIMIAEFNIILENISDWKRENIEEEIKYFIDQKKIKFYLFGKPARLILINSENGPSIGDILFIFGKKDSIERIKDYIKEI